MADTKHIPVLLDETMAALDLHNGDVVVDTTLGGGGYALALLERVLPNGRVIALDTDHEAIARFEKRLETLPWAKTAWQQSKLVLYHRNFSQLEEVLNEADIESVAAIVADLGFSSDQIEDPARGLSFLQAGPLDMRFDQRQTLTTETIVNTYSEIELASLIRTYGDERNARRIARAIVEARAKTPIRTTQQLTGIIDQVVRRGKAKIHPATQTFQAFRIAVNDELSHLEKFIEQAIRRLCSDSPQASHVSRSAAGRLAIVAFHSGEDALVKKILRENARGCICPNSFPLCRCGKTPRVKLLTKKPIQASAAEVRKNPRARSAKLRVAARL